MTWLGNRTSASTHSTAPRAQYPGKRHPLSRACSIKPWAWAVHLSRQRGNTRRIICCQDVSLNKHHGLCIRIIAPVILALLDLAFAILRKTGPVFAETQDTFGPSPLTRLPGIYGP